jgi:DedD protein
MDEQLKQRLIGATIIVTLIVIFVPMLFEAEPEAPAEVTAEGVPELPRAIEEQAIELPKTAADIALEKGEAEGEGGGKPGSAAPQTGYRIIPLDDPPPKPVEPEPATPAQGTPEATGQPAPEEAAAEDDFAGEEEPAPPAEGETADAPVATAAGQPAAAPVPAGAVGPAAKLAGDAAAKKPEPAKTAPRPAAPPIQAKPKPAASSPEDTAARKPESGKPAVTPDSAKPVAVAKTPAPKPSAAAEPAKTKTPPKTAAAEPAKAMPKSPATDPAKTVPPAAAAKPAPPQPKPAAPKPAAATIVAKAPEAKPPEKSQAAHEPSGPSSWVIQTGSFTGEDSARALAAKLRKSNFAAYVEQVSGSAGTVYRVRVGPELQRDRAEQVKKKIETTVGIRGIVLPH